MRYFGQYMGHGLPNYCLIQTKTELPLIMFLNNLCEVQVNLVLKLISSYDVQVEPTKSLLKPW